MTIAAMFSDVFFKISQKHKINFKSDVMVHLDIIIMLVTCNRCECGQLLLLLYSERRDLFIWQKIIWFTYSLRLSYK